MNWLNVVITCLKDDNESFVYIATSDCVRLAAKFFWRGEEDWTQLVPAGGDAISVKNHCRQV